MKKKRYIFVLLVLLSIATSGFGQNSLDLLNEQQTKYLQEKKVLKICVHSNSMPLEKIEGGWHVGMAADFIKEIAKKIQTPIQLVPTQNWSQSLQKIKNQECDLISIAQETPSRKRYFTFSEPYIIMPLVIATKIGHPFIDTLSHIKNRSLAIVQNHAQYEMLQAKYPEIDLVEVESIKEGLELVEQEKIFGFLDNSLRINHEIQKYNMNENIVISGQFKESIKLSIASRNDEVILGEILQKALLSIDRDTKENIIYRWKNIKYQTKTDNDLILQLLFFALVVISAFIYWNLLLREEIKSKELAQQQLHITKQELEDLNNSLEYKIKEEIAKSTRHQVMLMQQSKLAQMGEMIENIAHQWRQPLAQINASVLLIDTLLMQKNIQDGMLEDQLSDIESLTLYMSKTIDDFKNFFNPKKQKSTFFVEEAIVRSYDIVKGIISSYQIQVDIQVDKDLQCTSYLNELQQVILTLLNNAIEAFVALDIKSPQIDIKAFMQDGMITIEVEDNALGIKEALLDKIFDPYFTTKHKSQGTGLGLYMAKMIIQNGLDGALGVVNTSKGACFTIKVPQGDLDAKTSI